MSKVEYRIGNTLDLLKELDDESVQLVVTSPPYWGLRDYGDGAKTIWDGDKECDHEWNLGKTRIAESHHRQGSSDLFNGKGTECWGDRGMNVAPSGFCSKCGAWYGQLGLEPTLDMYLDHLLQITFELKRVLKKDGVMFWNHGDSYSAKSTHANKKGVTSYDNLNSSYGKRSGKNVQYEINRTDDIRPKSLCFQNIRLVLKMVDEQGWILRNDIIWHKPNHMPSSVKDRFTNTYEHIFMLVKNKKYYFNLDAVREPFKDSTIKRISQPNIFNQKGGEKQNILRGQPTSGNASRCNLMVQSLAKNNNLTKHEIATNRTGNYSYDDPLHQRPLNVKGKNPGDVWTLEDIDKSKSKFLKSDVKTASPGAREIRTVLSGKLTTTTRNRIKDVGQYLKNKLKESSYSKDELADILVIPLTTLEHYFRSDLSGQAIPPRPVWNALQPLLNLDDYDNYIDEEIKNALPQPHPLGKNPGDVWTITTKPYKETHFATFPPDLVVKPILSSSRPGDLVLDPFAGSGTVGEVCQKYNRDCLLFEINPEYETLIKKRCHLDSNLEKYGGNK